MYEGAKIERWKAYCLAAVVVQRLQKVCQRVEIAGSLRRKKALVGDIEIVCVPNQVMDLIGEKSYLWGDVRDALATFALLKGGDRYQQYGLGICKAGIFVTTPEQWGMIYTIRTGSAEFSHRLVTPRMYGGLLPEGFCVKDGRLWNRGVALETPEEQDVFKAIGKQWVEPENR